MTTKGWFVLTSHTLSFATISKDICHVCMLTFYRKKIQPMTVITEVVLLVTGSKLTFF